MTLISVHQLTKMGLHILFYDTGMCAFKTIYDVRKDKPLIKTEKEITDKMWTIPIKAPSPYANAVPRTVPSPQPTGRTAAAAAPHGFRPAERR